MIFEEYVEYLSNFLSTAYEIHIAVPNLYETPYIVVPTLLGTEQYYFEYSWNVRQKICYLSIFKIKNSERIYFLKRISLKRGIVLSDKITNPDFSGYLSFENIEGISDVSYTIKDISEKFEIFYAYRV